MTVPWLIGQFFESYGPQAMVLLIIASLMAALITLGVFLWMVREDKPPRTVPAYPARE